MSAEGRIFVSIDPSSLQALVAQLQAGQGYGGGGVGGEGEGAGASDSSNKWYLTDSQRDSINRMLDLPDTDITGLPFPDDSGGNDLPRIPYGLRTIMGVGGREAGIGGTGFQIAREYNLASGFINSLEDGELTLGVALGGAALGLLVAVQIKSMYDQFQAQLEKMKKDVERQSGIDGSTYDSWLKIQSDPLMRRNI